MAKKEIVESLVRQEAESRGWYVLESKVVPAKGTVQVRLIVDSESGVGIDACAELSRVLYPLIESSQVYADFELMVSSPGVGEPLVLPFQIKKNIGRLVKVLTVEGKTWEGRLVEYTEGLNLTVAPQNNKSKKEAVEPITISTADIKKIVVLVSFNG